MKRTRIVAAAMALGAPPGAAAEFADRFGLRDVPASLGLKTEPPASESSARGPWRIPRPSALAQADALGRSGTVGAAGASRGPPRDWAFAGDERRSALIPALEIVGFDLLLNRFDRIYFGGTDYDANWSTVRRNLRGSWVVDNDPYTINQLGHPYQGAMYHGFARSAGLGFWPSLGYTFAGSLYWEIAGEATPPSKNDQVASGIAGSFLGEALYRMANLVLEQGQELSPRWREVAAAVISPPTGFNRLAFGNRFDAIFSSRDAAYYGRLAVGASRAVESTPGPSTRIRPNEALVDFSLDYGLPKAGYVYRRPFDYFSFQATASSATGFDSLTTRGVLLGNDYALGERYRGVWGLYGSYDYFSSQVFRLSSTALSLGTTAEWRLAPRVALQGTAMAGAGYASTATIDGPRDERDFRYGVAPQALLALRLVLDDRASIDLTAREYFVSNVVADRGIPGGHDNIFRADLAFTLRVHRQHAVSVRYLHARRDARYPGPGDIAQGRRTLGIFYTLLGDDRFGLAD